MVEVALEDKTAAKVFGKVWFKFMERLKKVCNVSLEAALAVAQEKAAVAQRELGATGGGKRRRVGGRRTY